MEFTALLHHVTEKLLWDSFYRLKKEAAPGVDEVTWQECAERAYREQGLEARIRDLHGRVHRGAYRAQPSRRVYIPKLDGRQRPLGIAAVEDKVVQQAVVTVLNQIYEADFVGCSYAERTYRGFRPGKSAHDALDAVSAGIVRKKVNWILDADIRGFFDTIDHKRLMRYARSVELIERRVADPRILRLIQKWLQAGVSEEGQWSETQVGTPQGAVISPLLANIYLHSVLDQWVMEWRKQYAGGDVVIPKGRTSGHGPVPGVFDVRYADDFVLGFQYQKAAGPLSHVSSHWLRPFGKQSGFWSYYGNDCGNMGWNFTPQARRRPVGLRKQSVGTALRVESRKQLTAAGPLSHVSSHWLRPFGLRPFGKTRRA